MLKAAALASSILLVGGLVAYRANAFNRRTEPSTGEAGQTIMSGSKSAVQAIAPPMAATADSQALNIPSPKSGPIFLPPAPVTVQSSETILYSSKGGVLITPSLRPLPNSDATMMSSSKSIILAPPVHTQTNQSVQGAAPSATINLAPPTQSPANGIIQGIIQPASRSR